MHESLGRRLVSAIGIEWEPVNRIEIGWKFLKLGVERQTCPLTICLVFCVF